jgi:hypothetical protein
MATAGISDDWHGGRKKKEWTLAQRAEEKAADLEENQPYTPTTRSPKEGRWHCR